MSKKKISFMGLLANVDSSIIKLNLDHGFKIESMSQDEGIRFISILESLPPVEVGKKLFMDFRCLNTYEKKFYFISNSFEDDIKINNAGNISAIPPKSAVFNTNLVDNYLSPLIRLVRLFKEGNICMPLRYYFFIDNQTPKSFMNFTTGAYISMEPIYTLENSEILDLQGFIQNTKLPFTESSLRLAFENFELSYQTSTITLSFLSLMISLETLFHPADQDELSYRISRNAAILLGNDEEDSEEVYSKIRKLYNKRSKLVHSGKSDINVDDLLKLRNYVRESIKKIYNRGIPKDEFLKILHSSGFYQKDEKS